MTLPVLPHHLVFFVVTFALTVMLGPLLIPLLRRLKFGQTVRDDGPSTHFVKTGTPTMGGLIFLLPIVGLSVWIEGIVRGVLPLALVTVGCGLIGLLDDLIKVVKKRKDGLFWNQKLLGLLAVAVLFALYVAKSGIGTDWIFPGVGWLMTIPYGLFIPLTALVIVSCTNAVNITDGLDGLASGITLIISVFFTLVASMSAEGEAVRVFSAMVSAGCLGFLVFNLHPAKVFMGDVGSLALGGAVAAIAIAMKLPILLLLVGFVYVAETLSVGLQVGSYKLRGKRIFKMAPLHHHFELSGWKETRVVGLFWMVTVVCCVLGFVLIRL